MLVHTCNLSTELGQDSQVLDTYGLHEETLFFKKSTNRQHQYCVYDATPSLIQIKLKNVQCMNDYYTYIKDITFCSLKFIAFIKY